MNEQQKTEVLERIKNIKSMTTRIMDECDALRAENERLRAINAAQLEALQILVIIDRSDNIGDPDTLATDRWRHEAWSNAYAIIDAETV